eukprot:COSAG06_NODE_56790_length_283_cov_0.782609_2_plen_39_part_01
MVDKIACHMHPHVKRCPLPFRDTVVAMRVRHVVKRLALQ